MPTATRAIPLPVRRIYLIAGGSNADGWAPVSQMPGNLGSLDGVQIYVKPDSSPTDNGAWAPLTAGRHGNNIDPERPAPEPLFGPEMQLGFRLRERFGPGICLVKRAALDAGLIRTPAAQSWHPDDSGSYLDSLIDRYLLAGVKKVNGLRKIAGFVWVQGEADAALGASLASGYEDALRSLVQDVRTRLRSPSLPFVLARIPRVTGNAGEDIVRTAQISVASDTPGVFMVNTDSFALNADGKTFSAAGQVALGNALADFCAASP